MSIIRACYAVGDGKGAGWGECKFVAAEGEVGLAGRTGSRVEAGGAVLDTADRSAAALT